MPTFGLAAQQADVTGAPGVEGFAVGLAKGASAAAVRPAVVAAVEKRLPGSGWTADEVTPGWLVCRADPSAAAGQRKPAPLGTAWDAVRDLKGLKGVAS